MQTMVEFRLRPEDILAGMAAVSVSV